MLSARPSVGLQARVVPLHHSQLQSVFCSSKSTHKLADCFPSLHPSAARLSVFKLHAEEKKTCSTDFHCCNESADKCESLGCLYSAIFCLHLYGRMQHGAQVYALNLNTHELCNISKCTCHVQVYWPSWSALHMYAEKYEMRSNTGEPLMHSRSTQVLNECGRRCDLTWQVSLTSKSCTHYVVTATITWWSIDSVCCLSGRHSHLSRRASKDGHTYSVVPKPLTDSLCWQGGPNNSSGVNSLLFEL